nr:hypothetical protein [Fretibacterium sp.]
MALFKKKVELRQQTPMIHFQAMRPNDGTLLRATEVKPKLDRFIYEWCRVRGNMEVPAEWLASKDHKALDYRLRFDAGGQSYRLADPAPVNRRDNPVPVSERTGNLYFGNMGGGPRKNSLFYKSAMTMTILCFHPALMKVIGECLDTFFLTVNFGTRQNKGFGGFVTAAVAREQPDVVARLISSWYRDAAGTTVYRLAYPARVFQGPAANSQELKGRAILRDVSAIYQVLKSGINYDFHQDNPQRYIKSFLTRYFWDRHISGEKRYMKVKGIAPVKNRDPERELTPQVKDDHRTYRYIRGLLGSSGTQEWQSERDHRDKVKINFECAEQDEKKKCARIPSPIL